MAEYPHPSSAGRSANMRANRRTDTKPELALRRALHKLGYRFRKDYRLDLDGGRRVRPDIAFTARRVAIFVDGCVWHACPQHGSKPRANDWYWTPKLARNVERDRVADHALAAVIAVVGARPPVDPVAPPVDLVAPPVDPVDPPLDPVALDDDPVAADSLRANRSADKI